MGGNFTLPPPAPPRPAFPIGLRQSVAAPHNRVRDPDAAPPKMGR
jgi:hypothetical protein